MAGGRRNINRSGSTRPHSFLSDDSKSKCGPETNTKTVSPKHMPMPALPHDSTILFEVIMFIYSVTAVFLQFLHLYRSVWWLPHSHVNHAVNFYLIDPHLVGFILTILIRRLLYSILSYIILLWAPAPLWTLLEQLIRLFLLGVVMTCLVWCTFHVMRTHPLVNIFYLCYPISVYFILFGLNISPFFDVTSLPCTPQDDYKNRLIGRPLHSCSTTANTIREEVDNLRSDFNSRMKQILFSSMLNAYYTGFIPCCFAQSYLFYDVYWATQHLTFVWFGCFTMYLIHCYPVKWNDSTVWQQGALVKYCKEYYKAEGISNAGEPGNSNQSRFYSLFHNPSVLLCSLVGLQLSLVVLQLIILTRTSEWYKVISISLLLFANHYPLFKLSRDYLICWKVYKAEAMIQDKTNGG